MEFIKSMSLVFLSEHQSNKILNPMFGQLKNTKLFHQNLYLANFSNCPKQSLLCFIITGINVFIVNSLEKGFFGLVT